MSRLVDDCEEFSLVRVAWCIVLPVIKDTYHRHIIDLQFISSEHRDPPCAAILRNREKSLSLVHPATLPRSSVTSRFNAIRQGQAEAGTRSVLFRNCHSYGDREGEIHKFARKGAGRKYGRTCCASRRPSPVSASRMFFHSLVPGIAQNGATSLSVVVSSQSFTSERPIRAIFDNVFSQEIRDHAISTQFRRNSATREFAPAAACQLFEQNFAGMPTLNASYGK